MPADFELGSFESIPGLPSRINLLLARRFRIPHGRPAQLGDLRTLSDSEYCDIRMFNHQSMADLEAALLALST
ncbi:hypothetical protein [Streptosporangium sp. KLBMP 9127]|nr:hypothetical protein [Streptosporangium sp. KLBMP 9127]